MESPLQELPEEIILKILSHSGNETRTLLYFGQTCKKFHNLVHDPILWKRRLQIRYPKIYEVILEYGTDDFFEQYKYVQKLECSILKELKEMSPKLFWRSTNLVFEDAAPYFRMCGERNISLYCVHSLLVDTHSQSGQVIESDYPTTSMYSLTIQYYAAHVMRFMMHLYLILYWRGMKLTLNQLSPERTLNFYVNWVDTFSYVDYSVIKNMLDELAKEVWKELPVNHPVHSVSQETREKWIEGPTKKNQWKPDDNLLVHAAIRNLIYNKMAMKIEGSLTPRSLSLINTLRRKKGHQYTVAVLYEALARRSGLKCPIVTFSHHFFLEWRESYEENSPKYRINVATGEIERMRTCPFTSGIPSTLVRDYEPEDFILLLTEEFRQVLDHERNASLIIKVEGLHELLQGQEGNEGGLYQKKYNTLLNFTEMNKWLTDRPSSNFKNLEENFRRLFLEYAIPTPDDTTGPEIPKRTVYRNRRSSQVYFAVGMVCGHRMYNYTCVVTGWDATCTAPPEWQARMAVHQLMYKAQQPFYNVYATDGTTRYVAQENLNLIVGQRPKIIEDVIGKDFSHFNGTYYIPNQEKQKEYPDEQQVIAAYRRVPTLLSAKLFMKPDSKSIAQNRQEQSRSGFDFMKPGASKMLKGWNKPSSLLVSSCKLTKPVPGHMQLFNWR